MKRILLHAGNVALVDDAVWGRVRQHRWHLRKSLRGVEVFRLAGGVEIPLAREVARAARMPEGRSVEFRDGNPLNCRLSNLRVGKRLAMAVTGW